MENVNKNDDTYGADDSFVWTQKATNKFEAAMAKYPLVGVFKHLHMDEMCTYLRKTYPQLRPPTLWKKASEYFDLKMLNQLHLSQYVAGGEKEFCLPEEQFKDYLPPEAFANRRNHNIVMSDNETSDEESAIKGKSKKGKSGKGKKQKKLVLKKNKGKNYKIKLGGGDAAEPMEIEIKQERDPEPLKGANSKESEKNKPGTSGFKRTTPTSTVTSGALAELAVPIKRRKL